MLPSVCLRLPIDLQSLPLCTLCGDLGLYLCLLMCGLCVPVDAWVTCQHLTAQPLCTRNKVCLICLHSLHLLVPRDLTPFLL